VNVTFGFILTELCDCEISLIGRKQFRRWWLWTSFWCCTWQGDYNAGSS